MVPAASPGLPSGSVVKNPPANAGGSRRFWVGKIPWRRAWQPTSLFLPGESNGQRGVWEVTVHGVTKSQTWRSDWATTHITSLPPLKMFAPWRMTTKGFSWPLHSHPRTCALAFFFRWLLLVIRKTKETWYIRANSGIFWRTRSLDTWVLECQLSKKLYLLSLRWVSLNTVGRSHGAHFIWP